MLLSYASLSKGIATSTLQAANCRRYILPATLFKDLEQRGFVHGITKPPGFQSAFEASPRVVYAGIDPTADSLHVGHLLPMMCLVHFQIRGHQVIPLIGGATGLVGDPSGRATERSRADPQEVQGNVEQLSRSVQNFFKNALTYANTRLQRSDATIHEPRILNNFTWLQDMGLLQFLQTVGSHSRVNTMLNRESVQGRIRSQQGISFTEFTYQLLQAYDFYHLYKHHNCVLQVGGSDQWGNILTGLDLIQKLENTPSNDVLGMTTPLLVTASGQKFGKSAGNAVWLNAEKTPGVDLYQFFLRTPDADVERYLNLFTLLPIERIRTIVDTHSAHPEKRFAQRCLADEVTELVHGEAGLAKARTVTNIFFNTDHSQIHSQLKADDVLHALAGDPRLVMVDREEVMQQPVVKLASKYGLVPTSSQARNLIRSRGLYLNTIPLSDPRIVLCRSNLIDGRIAVMRVGQAKFLILMLKEVA